MSEGLIKELIEKIEDKAYVPCDWVGVSENKIVSLNDVISILNEYRPREYWHW